MLLFRELMMGDEGKPGKKIKVKGKVKRPDRPPENPVVDVSPSNVIASFFQQFMKFQNISTPKLDLATCILLP